MARARRTLTGGTDCPAVDMYGWHLDIVCYSRPWRRWWRKTHVIRCWKCDLHIEDP